MSFPEEVYNTLSSNSQMKKFLHIVKDNDANSYDYMVPIGKLTSYYNLTLLQTIKPTNHTPNCESLPKNNLMIYHKLRFIEYLIYEKRKKHRQKMIDFANNVLEFLIKWKKSDDGMIIHVNEEELKTYLVADPKSVVILLNKFNFYISLITPILNSLSTKENVQAELVYVLEDISKSLIKRTSYFPIHRLQDKFETLFLSPLLPFKETMDHFFNDFPPQDSQTYLQELFSFVLSVFSVIKVSQKPFDSTLVLLIIRLLFDRTYDRNVYLTNNGRDVLHELSNITVKEFTPPSDFSPKYSSDNTTIVQLFRNDKYFSEAVSELENIAFYTNPFDLLNCVDLSLAAIEKAATEYNNYQTMVFPFEVTFELFLAVVIASQIPNWENVSKMVNIYTPNVGLCPSFEFSKAKIAASLMQFLNMIDEINGEDVNDRKEKASDYLINVSNNCEKMEKETDLGILPISNENIVENRNPIDNKIENTTNLDSNDYTKEKYEIKVSITNDDNEATGNTYLNNSRDQIPEQNNEEKENLIDQPNQIQIDQSSIQTINADSNPNEKNSNQNANGNEGQILNYETPIIQVSNNDTNQTENDKTTQNLAECDNIITEEKTSCESTTINQIDTINTEKDEQEEIENNDINTNLSNESQKDSADQPESNIQALLSNQISDQIDSEISNHQNEESVQKVESNDPNQNEGKIESDTKVAQDETNDVVAADIETIQNQESISDDHIQIEKVDPEETREEEAESSIGDSLENPVHEDSSLN